MLTERNTRRLSLEAKRERARSHGWNVSHLPLRASIAERLQVKAEADDELGDEADAALERCRDALQGAWTATGRARESLAGIRRA